MLPQSALDWQNLALLPGQKGVYFTLQRGLFWGLQPILPLY